MTHLRPDGPYSCVKSLSDNSPTQPQSQFILSNTFLSNPGGSALWVWRLMFYRLYTIISIGAVSSLDYKSLISICECSSVNM